MTHPELTRLDPQSDEEPVPPKVIRTEEPAGAGGQEEESCRIVQDPADRAIMKRYCCAYPA